jgi:hypothetical protein
LTFDGQIKNLPRGTGEMPEGRAGLKGATSATVRQNRQKNEAAQMLNSALQILAQVTHASSSQSVRKVRSYRLELRLREQRKAAQSYSKAAQLSADDLKLFLRMSTLKVGLSKMELLLTKGRGLPSAKTASAGWKTRPYLREAWCRWFQILFAGAMDETQNSIDAKTLLSIDVALANDEYSQYNNTGSDNIDNSDNSDDSDDSDGGNRYGEFSTMVPSPALLPAARMPPSPQAASPPPRRKRELAQEKSEIDNRRPSWMDVVSRHTVKALADRERTPSSSQCTFINICHSLIYHGTPVLPLTLTPPPLFHTARTCSWDRAKTSCRQWGV